MSKDTTNIIQTRSVMFRKSILLILFAYVLLNGQVTRVLDFYTGKEIQWERDISENFTIAVAKESGDFVITEVDEHKYTGLVEYFSSDGISQWKIDDSQSWIQQVVGIFAQISDNGESVLVSWVGDYESVQRQVINKNGEITYDEHSNSYGGRYTLSPDGKYFHSGVIRKYDGSIVAINIPHIFKRQGYAPAFLNDSIILIMMWETKGRIAPNKEQGMKWYLYDLSNDMFVQESENISINWDKQFVFRPLVNHFIIENKHKGETSFYDNTGTILWSKPNNLGISQNAIIDFSRKRIIDFRRSTLFIYDYETGDKIGEYHVFDEKKYQFSRPIVFTRRGNFIYAVGKLPLHYPDETNMITLFWNLDNIDKSISADGFLAVIPGTLAIIRDDDKYKLNYYQ